MVFAFYVISQILLSHPFSGKSIFVNLFPIMSKSNIIL